jgi:hypothetical protein
MRGPAMEIWVLTFFVLFGEPFIGGEYQTRERCEDAALHQSLHWHITYSHRLIHKCELKRR